MREMHNIVVGRDDADASRFGERGTGIIGRHYVGAKKEAHLTNPVRIDFARPHIIGIFGKRGTGKSHSMGVLAEEMALLEDDVRKNLSCVIVDSMGIFWSMKNQNDREAPLFAEWNLKPMRFSISLLVPDGQRGKFAELGIPYDFAFSISPKELNSEDWALTFGIDLDSELGVLLQKSVKRAKKLGRYSIEDLALQVRADNTASEHVRDALINRFAVASEWGVFEQGHKNAGASQRSETAGRAAWNSEDAGQEQGRQDISSMFEEPAGARHDENFAPANPPANAAARMGRLSLSSVLDIALPGKITVVDLSMVEDLSVRCLIAGLLSKKILEARMESRRLEEMESMTGEYNRSKMPMTWIFIDEAQQFLPANASTPATAPLLQCVKIGREPGVSMVFATQQPNKLHEAAISQCDLVISHRLTAKQDIDSLKNIMQTYLKYDLQEYIDALPRAKGAAIVLDDNSERIYAMRVRPRLSWHAGGSPSAVKENIK